MSWSFWEWVAWAVLAGLGFWLISTALDMGLDWLLQRRVRQEIEEMNKKAPLPKRVPQQRKSEENDADGA